MNPDRALRAGVVGALVLGFAACGGGSSATSRNSAAPTTAVPGASSLGPEARATGTPVKVGYITDGSNGSSSGSQYEEAVAKATQPWLNEHMNGLGGHPIELDICVDDLDPGKAIDCANQMIRDLSLIHI